jgi:CRP/FNR family transcriptional regulator, cyclic AMP receptor protein
VKSIADLLTEVPVLVGLSEQHRELIAGCGENVIFEAGEYVFREGEPANRFFAVRRGDVALEFAPPAAASLIIETLHAGDVLGWSWLFPPYRVRYDARAMGEIHALAFDGACLRGKCEADHDLGYELMRRFAEVITERLQATRIRLLDVYGAPAPVES